MKRNKKYPIKHLSLRVPWHDNRWNGTICNHPRENSSCLILKNCALSRNDEKEESLAGKSIEELQQGQFPSCIGERGTFMSGFSFAKLIEHPYKKRNNDKYLHFKETPLRFPAYGAAGVPFLWMMREEAEKKALFYDLDYDINREPDLQFSTTWLQDYHNQKALLDCFFEHVEPINSLCFIYAKDVPFVETSGRVLIGVGRVKHISDGVEYEYEAKGGIRSMLWEHMIQHSIRPDFSDGFLLPYHDALDHALEHPEFNPAELAVIAPNEKMTQFSYATEHVTNDTAIKTLLLCVNSLEKANQLGIGNRDWEPQIKWLHERINELEKIRGHYPGLGSALTAFGLSKGHFIAQQLTEQMSNDNVWELVNKMFASPSQLLSADLAKTVTDTIRQLWRKIYQNPSSTRLTLLQLISRFDLTIEQAIKVYVKEEREKEGIFLSDDDILDNPYLLVEQTVYSEEPIDFWTIDYGLFPKKVLNEAVLLPNKVQMTDPLNPKRIRALTVMQLRKASEKGHTLLPQKELVLQIRDLPLLPECQVSKDYFDIAEDLFGGVIIRTTFNNGEICYQLNELHEMGKLINSTVRKRKTATPFSIEKNWRKIIDNEFKNDQLDELEELARVEKAAALETLSQSKFSVLVGSAGTGKTTILAALCAQEEIKKDGVLFLAPTGKARVRMKETTASLNIEAYTLAQFLSKYNRYDTKKMLYQRSKAEKCISYGTVIVDESSMLTEEMLAALFDACKGVKRYILVGDDRQLPPIGPGRPFVDIVNYLKPNNIDSRFPKVGPSYSELTIQRRQRDEQTAVSIRKDMMLAKWFSGKQLDVSDDEVFQELMLGKEFPELQVISWKGDHDFIEKLKQVLVKTLELNDIGDEKAFNNSLGAFDGKYFNFQQAVDKIEEWQILSPIRGTQQGTLLINRLIHQLFRKDTVDYTKWLKSEYRAPKLPKPLGTEEITYGDKVINTMNHSVYSNRVYPEGGQNYIANGEIGIVVGQFKNKFHKFKGQPKNTEVEFASQKGYKYTFYQSDFKEEGESTLELAYAITIHKSQGSEFETTFVVLPKNSFNLSRELIYTALTRQKGKVIILFQGDNIIDLKKYSTAMFSETTARLTNLLEQPNVKEIEGKYLSNYLIHAASDYTMLRSKSELIIYETLLKHQLDPMYEQELTINGQTKLPDFTIIDDDSDITYYWEHCGMLTNDIYKQRWEAKKQWYFENGILPLEEGGGPNGTLIVTVDSPESGISVPEIESIIKKMQ
ncbi:ATP-dependent RecD-like DNA helicase [Bacillus cereus group sp. BfR-BA-01310]|uniref:ATP-dependent DNA helicase n=1 Tax=Bacillus cereus group sp. BfR-BA-01310 TaxID=2920287 RepID=UPI001F59A919|nr:AAA family ATPase [Bacillus cereus group sp. BfR-BA-01310]